MKKTIQLTFNLILVLSMFFSVLIGVGQRVQAESGFAGGSGTAADPYLVATAAQLDKVRNHLDKHFRQVAHIDLGVAPWNEDKGWTSIGTVSDPLDYEVSETFSGSYDGNNFIIRNLTIDANDPVSQMGSHGLFGFVGEAGLLERIKLEGVNIRGRDFTGALAGKNSGTVRGSSATGQIEDTEGFDARNVGGLVGMNAGWVMESFSAVTVESYENFGGLVGNNTSGAIIKNCYSTGNVTRSQEVSINGAGLVGLNAGLIQNCYTTGKFDEHHLNEMAIANNFGQIRSSYYDVTAYGLTEPVDPNGKTAVQMKQQATYVDWDFDHIWQIDEGFSTPYHIPTRASRTPAITSDDRTTFTVGEVSSFIIRSTGVPFPTITLVNGDLPDGVELTDRGDGTASLAGTPDADSGGIYELTISAVNGIRPDASQDFTLTLKTVTEIGISGGGIQSNQDQIIITVPNGALDGAAEFEFYPLKWPTKPMGSLSFARIGFLLTAEYTATGFPVVDFNELVTIRITYAPDSIGLTDPDTLRLYAWDGDAWVDVVTGCPGSTYTRPADQDWFEVGICHLTEFAMMGEFDGYLIYFPLISR
jgi:hypothetical protein